MCGGNRFRDVTMQRQTYCIYPCSSAYTLQLSNLAMHRFTGSAQKLGLQEYEWTWSHNANDDGDESLYMHTLKKTWFLHVRNDASFHMWANLGAMHSRERERHTELNFVWHSVYECVQGEHGIVVRDNRGKMMGSQTIKAEWRKIIWHLGRKEPFHWSRLNHTPMATTSYHHCSVLTRLEAQYPLKYHTSNVWLPKVGLNSMSLVCVWTSTLLWKHHHLQKVSPSCLFIPLWKILMQLTKVEVRIKDTLVPELSSCHFPSYKHVIESSTIDR